ncbi:uncharacterized protein LOC142328188 [Lycorma delicatula]|uniref:uncharacterized protein LOC142328188 n=1 Tax=Lycorma delicatula TaxID=130591 RepID=UPI003F51621F
MGLIRLYIWAVLALNTFFILQSSQDEGSPDTSLYDFVAYSLLEDYVDLLEMTTWFTRKVKDHIDELIENSFSVLIKQQDMLQPAIQMADHLNKPHCAEGKIMNITDAVFKEYFNMNLNCPMIGQKMSVFFNEIHNITSRVTDIHRRYIGSAANCGPPIIPVGDRNCLQNLVNQGKKETEIIRNYMLSLSYDVEEFMDGQIEEAFECLLRSCRNVRNATKQAVQDIHCCLDMCFINLNDEFESPFLDLVMGKVENPFSHLGLSKEETTKQPETPQQQFINQRYQGFAPQHGMPHPHMHGAQHPPNPQHRVMPGQHPQPYIQGQHPGMHPQYIQQPGIHPQQPGVHPHNQQQQQPPQMPQQLPKKDESKNPPPWKTSPDAIPKYAKKNNIIQDGSFEFDASMFEGFDASAFEGFDPTEFGGFDSSTFEGLDDKQFKTDESKRRIQDHKQHESL